MATSSPSRGSEPIPGSLRSTRSFSRVDSQSHKEPDPPNRPQRASTFQNGSTTPQITIGQHDSPQKQVRLHLKTDNFETSEPDEPIGPPRASVDMEDIPIEVVSMIDNFIDTLSAKVHPTPPNIENLSRLFQDFYYTAAQHIQTHIASLSTRQTRPPVASRPSAASILRAKAAALGGKEKAKDVAPVESEQQMLTAQEFAEKKKARKALEQKRILLEEAVERRLCEGIYERIYRHRTTQDEAQDDKLRSKTAALSVVGIGLKDLDVDLGESSERGEEAPSSRQDEVHQSLEQARRDLTLMSEKRYPLGKLNCLKAAHKSIVDTLTRFHPSSSADEIIPMLIYTLITMPPEKLNVISDSNFIQRFRWEEKMDGEASYCVTNLDATIAFLLTVDLASLRASEAASGPPRTDSAPGTPKTETFPPAYTPGLSVAATSPTVVTTGSVHGFKAPPSPTSARAAFQRRRLSDLIQTPAQAIGNARDSFFDSADQSIKNISNSLGDSYKFWVGKFRDTAGGREIPKTLEDARRLIGTPPPDDYASADGSIAGIDANESSVARMEDKVLSLVGGRKASVARDRSADSTRSARSAGSGKKVAFASDENKETTTPTAGLSMTPPIGSNPALVDQMRNLTNSLNPMNRFAGMTVMRGFGRSTPTPTPPAKDGPPAKAVEGGDLASAFPDIAAALPPKDIPQVKAPNKRFMELQNPADLKLGEVLELLRDYRRLANALKDIGAFKET